MKTRFSVRARIAVFATLLTLSCAAWLTSAAVVHAIGERTSVDVRELSYTGGNDSPRPTAAQRLAWEVRQRTSVETRLTPTRVRLSDPSLFDSPLLYWSGSAAFPPLSQAESEGLRRFVEFGGFVWIDDAAPDEPGFDTSIRRELARSFGGTALARLPDSHVIYRSFYLVQKPVGRVDTSDHLEAITQGNRVGVVYSRQDLGGAFERDNVGNYAYVVANTQREMAFRLGVNLVLYALCLDYKDDQVHAPFIMRRWAGHP